MAYFNISDCTRKVSSVVGTLATQSTAVIPWISIKMKLYGMSDLVALKKQKTI